MDVRVAGGNWGATTFTLQSTSTTDEILYWKADDTAGTTAIYYKVSESKWYDGSSGGQPTAFSINDGTPSDPSAVVSAGDSVKLTAGSSGNYGSFTMFSTSSSSTPTYRTGTSKGFAFTSGAWKNNGYSAVLDDEANSSSGKLVNGVRQFEWDMPDIGGGRLYSGANNWIYFVPGTAEDNGTWYRGTSVATRSGRTINFGSDATFDETDAFVSGLVPYGDIP